MTNEQTEVARAEVILSPAGVPEARRDDPLSAIMRAAMDPSVDPAKLTQLFDLHQRMQADQSRRLYQEAMARLQAVLPRIVKDAAITVNGTVRSRYARYESIDRAVKPYLAAEGFSLAFDTSYPDGQILVTATVMHSAGHREQRSVRMPADSAGSKSPVQAVASTISYARRHLVKMALNIVEDGEDQDGSSAGKITEAQCEILKTLLAETNSDWSRFFDLYEIKELQDMPVERFWHATVNLETKRQKQKQAGGAS